MNVMTKRGSLDNVITYEHYCDTKTDLNNIPKDQITLGSVAIVLKDEDDNMGIYIANSNKEWISFSSGGGGSAMSDISLANLLDISLTNPTDGQTLVYNGETEKWENKNGGNSSGSDNNIMFITIEDSSSGITSDKTYEEISTHLYNGGYAICNIIYTRGNFMPTIHMASTIRTEGTAIQIAYTYFNTGEGMAGTWFGISYFLNNNDTFSTYSKVLG